MAVSKNDNPWEGGSTATAMKPGPLAPSVGNKSSGGLDVNVRKVIRVWPLAVLGGLLGLGVAWLMLRYAVPIYQASMQMSLKDDLVSTAVVPNGTFAIRDPFNDKVDMLQSPTVALRVVRKLGLQYGAVSKGQLKNKDLYGDVAWRVLNEKNYDRDFSFDIKPNSGNGFSWRRGNQSGNASWGIPFMMGADSVVVQTNTRQSPETEIVCTHYHLWNLARSTASRLAITPQARSSTITVSITDEVPQRATDILGELSDAFDQTQIESKNQSLRQSIGFIQDRLDPLEEELDSIENQIVYFKSSHKLVGAEEATSSFLAKTNPLDAELAEIEFQFELLKLLQRYINDPATKDENLSLVGLNDAYLQGLVEIFQRLRIERDKMAIGATPNNQRLKSLDLELQTAKDNIDVQINNYRRVLNLRQANAANRLNELNRQLLNAPANERELLAMERQRKIKQDLYVLFLERKEEAAITLAGTTSQTSVLSPPTAGGPISPKRTQLYAIGFGLGLLLPFAFAFIRELMDHSITSKKQIQTITGAPVLGIVDLASDRKENTLIVDQNDRSAVAEQIRSIRANLNFYAEEGKTLFIMVTSSFSGEGKTFISANLARTFSMQQLKVALIEFDMRKPKLAKNLGLSPKIGLSGALLGQYSFDSIIIPDALTPSMHLFPTGTVPPNPSELMAGARMKQFKQYLDDNYDVVVMDTPPMGLVSDAQLLTPWSDVTLLVVRYAFTPKEQLQEVNEWYRSGILGKMAIIFNGVKTSGYSGYKYSPYYYKHRYGSDYYVEDKRRKHPLSFLGFGKRKP